MRQIIKVLTIVNLVFVGFYLTAAQVRDQNDLNKQLLEAIENDRKYERVEQLLNEGANPNIVMPGADNNSLLQYVIITNKNPHIVGFLLLHDADIDYVNNNGQTATMLAIQYHKPDHLNNLMKFSPDLTIRDVGGRTVADYLAWYRQRFPGLYEELIKYMQD